MKIKAFTWPHGGNGIICLQEDCPHGGTCANHRSAGDFRTEDGYSPVLSISKGDAFCQTYDDGLIKVPGKGMVTIHDFPEGTVISGSYEMHLESGCAMCNPELKLVTPIDPMPPIPYGENHPGAFGVNRHEHVHTGVDLYAPYGCPVRAMEAGKIIAIEWFTGPSIKMPWWNYTRAVYIEGESGVFSYGEIQEYPNLKVGDLVEQGQYIGYVVTVLRHYKGRPMSMLHLELYDHGYTDTWGEWKIGEPKPEHLKDPTSYLLRGGHCKMQQEDPYLKSVEAYKQTCLNKPISQ